MKLDIVCFISWLKNIISQGIINNDKFDIKLRNALIKILDKLAERYAKLGCLTKWSRFEKIIAENSHIIKVYISYIKR